MAIIFHARAHAHAWSFSQDCLFRVLARFFFVVCGISARSGAAPVGSWLLSARMRTRGVFRTWRRSVDHHLYLRSSAVVLCLRVVSARACAYVVFFDTCRAAASILVCGASPGPLLGFSWAYPESSWAPQGLSWASLGLLLGLSWVLETCPNYERGCFVSQITAAKSLRVQGVGLVLQNTAPNASP